MILITTILIDIRLCYGRAHVETAKKRRDEIGRAHTTADARTRSAVEPYTTDGRALTQRPTGRRFYTRLYFFLRYTRARTSRFVV